VTSVKEPERISIVGGGRWARVTVDVLHEILPISTLLSIHSPRNADAMRVWAESRFGKRSFEISSALPVFSNTSQDALIVVNAARDHEAVAKLGIEAGIPVLIEKPLALNSASVNRLIDLAASCGAPLAAGHALRFARYVENFASAVAATGRLVSIRVRWCDARSEQRYGELKTYDSSIPVFVDCLPHVLSLISALIPVEEIALAKIQARHGGSEVEIKVRASGIPVEIVLARNSIHRQRWIEVVLGDGSKMTLNFQQEPGLISDPVKSFVADSLWNTAQRPLASMLSSFVGGLCSSCWDARLSPGLALKAAELVDCVEPRYTEQLVQWASEEVRKPEFFRNAEALDYALRELLQAQNALTLDELNRRVQLCLAARTLNVLY
jgi:predicted dehydrogenase